MNTKKIFRHKEKLYRCRSGNNCQDCDLLRNSGLCEITNAYHAERCHGNIGKRCDIIFHEYKKNI